MISRVWWIAVSYATRPMFLAMMGLGILFLAIDMIPASPHSNNWAVYPAAPSARLLVNSKATLDEVRKSGRQQEVDGIDLMKLWFDVRGPSNSGSPDEEFYRILEEFPNLRIVNYSYLGKSTGMDRIVSLAHLECLSLDGVGLYDLAPLQSLRNLRRLEIGLFEPPQGVNGLGQPLQNLEGIGALASLPKFDTLVLRSRSVVNDAVLTQVGTLPHLSVLVLDLADSPRTPISTTKTGFDALARAPALRTLYVGGCYPEDYRELALLAKASVPSVSILSSRYDPRVRVPFLVLLPCYWFAIAIGLQLSSQFVGPSSRLAPGFVAAHALVGIALSAGVIALGAARLITTGLTAPAAIAASSDMVATVIALFAASAWRQSSGRFRFKGAQYWMWLPPVLLLVVMVSLCTIGSDQRSSRLNSPGAITAFVLMGCAAAALACWTLVRLVEWSSGSSFPERRNLVQPQWFQAGDVSPWMFATDKRECQIEAWSQADRPWSWWHRIQRWRLGNPPFWSVPLTLVILCVLILPILMTIRFGGIERFSVMAAIFGLLAISAKVASRWRERLLVLPLELLRPYSRYSIQQELAVAFVLDLLPGAVLFAIVDAIGINMEVSLQVQWWSVPLSFVIFFILGYAWAVVSGGLPIVVRRSWLAIVLLIAFLLFNLYEVIWLIQLHQDSRDPAPSFVTPEFFQSQLWLPILTGVIVSWVLWRRWRHIEIAQWV